MLQATQFAYGHMICMKCIDNNITTGCDSDLVTTSKLSYTDSLCSKNNDDINDRTSESGSTKSESLNCKDNDMQYKKMYGKCNILDKGNVLLSSRKLCRFLEKNLVCRQCIRGNQNITESVLQDASVVVTTHSKGFAGFVNIKCRCKEHHFFLEPLRVGETEAIDSNPSEIEQIKAEESQKTYGILDYAINFNAYLLMQMLGIGLSGLTTIIAMLGIRASCGDVAVWHNIRDKVGEVEQNICKEVLHENLEREIDTTKESGEKQVFSWTSGSGHLLVAAPVLWGCIQQLVWTFFFDWCAKQENFGCCCVFKDML